MHLQNAMQAYGFKQGDFPVAESLSAHCLSLPLYPGMTADDQEYVIEIVQQFYQNSGRKV
jgi:dTDP-4-amino-4,6-dideoxygalactose transaminase